MKTTINRQELIEFEACEEGLKSFTEIHSDKTVKLSDCFDSNTLDDIFWLLEKLEHSESLSNSQIRDLRLYAADCAESVLHVYEEKYPNDDRPRLAIKAARGFANGLIDADTLSAARDVASDAARAAYWNAARATARSAARAAASNAVGAACAVFDASCAAAWVTESAASWVVRDAVRPAQSEKLRSLFISWENKEDELQRKRLLTITRQG